MQEDRMRSWLLGRRLSPSVIDRFGVRSGTHALIGECVVIPVADEKGDLAFNKYRRDPLSSDLPKYLYDQGGKVTLYGWHEAKACDRILFVEGELDCLAAWSANVPAVTSTGGANSFKEEWGALLKGKDVTLCFDADEAGAKGMVRALRTVPWAKVAFLPETPGVKDVSDYAIRGGDVAELAASGRHYEGIADVVADRARRAALWQYTAFHDAYIEANTVPAYVRKARTESGKEDAIGRAKGCPIGDLLKVNRQGKAICPFHAEDTPSLHWYRESNRAFCFGGCGKAYDAIDVYRKLNGCSFLEAVEALS